MNLVILIAIGIFFRIVSIVAMQVISNPKRPKMRKLGQSELVNSSDGLKKEETP
jgi:hypothetical protein